jgi:hypothetical protein
MNPLNDNAWQAFLQQWRELEMEQHDGDVILLP